MNIAPRYGKTEQGSHEYHLTGNYYACKMDKAWYVFERAGNTMQDTGFDFPTLRQCRQWAKKKEA